METTRWRWEQKLENELVQGMELAKRLKAEQRRSSSSIEETANILVQKILFCFEKSLLLLKCSGSDGQVKTTGSAAVLLPESPVSVNGSPHTEDFNRGHTDYYQEHNDGPKKRKTMDRWIEQVRVSTANGLEDPHDDRYSWRKYGQKDILGAKYPRSYYRCTFRNKHNCWATKQVQRSDEDPTLLEITYRGRHSCLYGNNAVPTPALTDKKQRKEYHHNIIHTHCGQSSQQKLTSLQDSLSSVHSEKLEAEEMAIYPFTFPSTTFGCITTQKQCPLPFPTDHNALYATESNYSPVLPAHVTNLDPIDSLHLQFSGSDHTEIISATTSTTNSSIPDLDFSLDPVQIDANFPFDSLELFS